MVQFKHIALGVENLYWLQQERCNIRGPNPSLLDFEAEEGGPWAKEGSRTVLSWQSVRKWGPRSYTTRNRIRLTSRRDKEMDCPIKSPQRDTGYWHCGFSLEKPMPDFWPTQLLDNTVVLLYATTSVVICHGNNSKLTECQFLNQPMQLLLMGEPWVAVWECMWTLSRLNKSINLKSPLNTSD